jgi:ribosomal protein S12 methylthiotransferase
MTVLVDGRDEHGNAVARSAADAPEIDGVVRIAGASKLAAKLAIGSFARVRVTGSDQHDLDAQVLS